MGSMAFLRSLRPAAIERDLLRSAQAARRLVFASRVLAGKAKCQTLGLCRERTERHLETPGAGHHASDRHEGGSLFGRLVNPVRQPTRAVRPDGHLIATTDRGHRMRERPDDRVRHNEVVERIWRFEVECLVRPAKVRTEQFIKRGVIV